MKVLTFYEKQTVTTGHWSVNVKRIIFSLLVFSIRTALAEREIGLLLPNL